MKVKLLLVFFLLNTLFIFSQTKLEKNTSKRIRIENPTESKINQLLKAGIDLRCGAIFSENSLRVELSSYELSNLDKQGIIYEVEIEDVTKFYAERAVKNLPIAKAQLAAEKATRKLNKKNANSSKSTASVSSVILDNPLQYNGVNEVDWAEPFNFNLGVSFGGCLTVQETLDELDQMRDLYSNLISVKLDASLTGKKTYGYAGSGEWSGQTIYYVKISDNPDGVDDATEPDILYTSMIHSRELSALMGNIYFMWYLLENYATDPAIKNLVDNNELFFVPIVNPDGLQWNEKENPNGGGMNRTNLRGFSNSDPTINSDYIENYGVDPNRNFNYLWGSAGDSNGSSGNYWSSTYRGPSAFSEPESQIMRDFVLSKNFKTAVWQHSYSNAIPHPYGGHPTNVSGREDEMHKWHEDMTKYNRYISGATIFRPANGIADDWMLGGTSDGNGSVGSGMNILATTPENGHGSERDPSYSSPLDTYGFWPKPIYIVPIAKRMVRINLMNAYYGGKYAKFHDLTQSDVNSLSSNLTFGIERIGQTASDFTLTVTPISGNITSITTPVIQTGISILEQRNVMAALVLDAGITDNEKIEYNVKLKNGDNVIFYEANFVKYYQPTVLFNDNPDTDISMANWVESSNWVNSTLSSWSGSRALKAGSSVPYANNINNTITTTNSYDFSGASEILVQFYAKWDIERNFDFVEIEGYDGSSWHSLTGKYNKPAASTNSNDSHGGKTSTQHSFQSSNSSGRVYDGDQFDNWVLEEIIIDAANNSALLNATNAKFRFRFGADSNNKPENYSTTYDGFYFDDFKIIKLPCEVTIPTNIVESSIASSSATIDWDNGFPSYDLRYRVTGTSTWIDVTDLSTTSHNLTALTASTEYEVQVRSKCGSSTISAFSTSITFTTLAQDYCLISLLPSATEEFISNVELANVSNSTPGIPNSGYSDFTGPLSNFPDLDVESGYTIKVTKFWPTTNKYDESVGIWIDFNADGDFLDADEEIFTSVLNQLDVIATVNIPKLATLGTTRMRVIMSAGTVSNPCNSFLYGEVEDYTINIIDSTLGIEDEILSTFQLYPNPVIDGEIKLKIPREITDFNVTISNVFGQKVYENSVNNNYETAHTINTSNLKSGIYFVTVSTNLGKATKKLIID